ncbi:MAG: LysE family translocator [Alphaproteobacteria bacterium]|nr:LysE family translocator [Alphaproteobacteria bacterium]
MSTQTLLLYVLAAIGLSVTPGPNSLLAITHGALHGHRRTLFTAGGSAMGFIALISLSLLGVGALLAASAQALTVLKFAGGAYLVYLGIQLWRAPPIQLMTEAMPRTASAAMLFRAGLLTALSNPKALLFYGAFLPQFLDPARDLVPQAVAMTAIFVVIEYLTEYLLALLAHRIRPLLERAGRRFNRMCGGMFIAMGVALPLGR